ncbi:MAG: 50S ribosomal protein L24 [Nanoarchaeota archaeon]|jgi:large subunit ribosomal protein L24|nr:50S ribosomal protein L24 [Nanoarchaeota archaeon]
MKKEFSNKWIASSQPRKQRKYTAKAPLHKKRRLLAVNLSKDLRSKHGIRNIELRKGDKVKVMRGKFKNKEGKVTKVLTKLLKIYIEGMQSTKQDGSKVDVPLRASNLQIVELFMDDKKRFKKTETPKKEAKPVTKEKKE